MRGRKPKPRRIKQLSGNPGKRPLEVEPRPPVPDRTPYVPRHLNKEGAREWRRIVNTLIYYGLYTVVDRAALAMYCQAWGRWVEAERMLKDTGGEILTAQGSGNLYQNPWFHVVNKAWDQLSRAITEFGLSPSARTRVRSADTPVQLSLAEMLFAAVEMDEDG